MNNNLPSHPSADRLARWILVFFFLSGMTALVYQIVWMRLISRIIGGAPVAVAAILVVFMGGLGIGGYVAGRLAHRFEGIRLIRVYGILEAATAVYALAVPFLLMASGYFYEPLYNRFYEHTVLYNLFIFAGAIVILAFPTLCMGANLPILCRFYVGSLSRLGTRAGRLYGLNTFGAAMGALVCGFWMIQYLGVWGTMLAAVAVNGAIGLLCLIVPAPAPAATLPSPGKPEKNPTASDTGPSPAIYSPGVIRGALILFMVSGFTAMACEVLWTRLLGLVVGPTTYSFTIVLVTFIVGLALGNMVFGRIADRVRNLPALLIATQIAAAFFALGVSQIFGNSQLFFAKLIYAASDHFVLLSLTKAMVIFGFMVLPTFFFGAAFPLVAKIHTRSIAVLGRSIGVIYAFNTIGAVAGAFIAGIVLIPLAGTEYGLRIVIGLQALVALGVGVAVLDLRTMALPRRTAAAGLLAIATALLCIAYPSWDRHNLATGKYHRFDEVEAIEEMIRGTGWLQSLVSGASILSSAQKGELVYYGDGIGGFTTVLKYPGPFGEAEFSMANSGKMDASSRGDMKTQTLLAHFPMLFSSSPENVMVLGLASGVTAGEVLHYPVEQVDVIDINDRVFEASRFFTPWNNNVLDDPRTHAIVQDALAHLGLTRTRYDAIISEPSNPWMAGMAALFTKEFFETARDRLTENGIYVQWFHCYQMDWPTFAMIGRTFAEVFPDAMLVSCEPGGLSRDFLFIGFKGEAGTDWDLARKNLRYGQASENIDLTRPELLARMIVSEDLEALFGEGPVNTDVHPLLEYSAPRLMYHGEETQQALLAQIEKRSRLTAKTEDIAGTIRGDIDRQIEFARYALSVHSPFSGMVDLSEADSGQRDRYETDLSSYCAENPMDLHLIGDKTMADRLRSIQIASIERRLPDMTNKAPAHQYLASLLADRGKTEKAIAHYKKAVALNPKDARSLNDLGFLLYQSGDVAAAISHYEKALSVRPRFVRALGNMAFAHLQLNRLDEALIYFRETLRVSPDIPDSHYYAGQILARQERFAEATAHFREAIRLDPGMTPALNTLAWILATAPDSGVRDPAAAVRHAETASGLTDHRNPSVLATLTIAYTAADRIDEARQTAELALQRAREAGRDDLVSLLQRHVNTQLRH